MKPHLRYLWYVLRHKWFVLLAGLRLGGIPLWRLIVHDSSKFSPAEWGPYVERFFKPAPWRRDRWERALIHHYNHNPHHWQYWVLVGGHDERPEPPEPTEGP